MCLRWSLQLCYVQSAISLLNIFVLRSISTKEKAYLGLQISQGTSGLDQYSLRYRVGGNSVNTKPVSGSLVNRKSFSGSSVISKVFGGNPVNCRLNNQ
jgi:hypothetical protein